MDLQFRPIARAALTDELADGSTGYCQNRAAMFADWERRPRSIVGRLGGADWASGLDVGRPLAGNQRRLAGWRGRASAAGRGTTSAVEAAGQAKAGGGTVVEFAGTVVPGGDPPAGPAGIRARGAASPDDLERVLAIAESNWSLTVWPRFFATSWPWPV